MIVFVAAASFAVAYVSSPKQVEEQASAPRGDALAAESVADVGPVTAGGMLVADGRLASREVLAQMRIDVPAATVVAPPPKHKPKHVHAQIAALREAGKTALADEIVAEIDRERAELAKGDDKGRRLANGRVIVGRVSVADGKFDPRDVLAQMEIFADGWFVESIADAAKPVCFRLEGYEPTDLVVGEVGTPDELVWVGEIVLKRADTAKKAPFTVNVTADLGQPKVTIKALMVSHILANTPRGGSEPRRSWNEQWLTVSGPPGTLRIHRTPGAIYWITAEAPGYQKVEAGHFEPTTSSASIVLRGIDTDKDSILDVDDKCPKESENRNGREDEDGCPEKVSTKSDPTAAFDEDIEWLMKNLTAAGTFKDSATKNHHKHGDVETKVEYALQMSRDGCQLKLLPSATYQPHWSLEYEKYDSELDECLVDLAKLGPVTYTQAGHFRGSGMKWVHGGRTILQIGSCRVSLSRYHEPMAKRFAAAFDYMASTCKEIEKMPTPPSTRDDGERRALANAAMAKGDCRLAAAALEQVEDKTRQDIGWVLLAAKAHACAENVDLALTYYRAAKAMEPTIKVDTEIGDLLMRQTQRKVVDKWWLRD